MEQVEKKEAKAEIEPKAKATKPKAEPKAKAEIEDDKLYLMVLDKHPFERKTVERVVRGSRAKRYIKKGYGKLK